MVRSGQVGSFLLSLLKEGRSGWLALGSRGSNGFLICLLAGASAAPVLALLMFALCFFALGGSSLSIILEKSSHPVASLETVAWGGEVCQQQAWDGRGWQSRRRGCR